MSLTLYAPFAATKSLTSAIGPAFACTRANATASRYNSSGLLEVNLAANTGRFDHDPVTGASLGLLIEEARTNICLQSNDLSTTWTNVRSTDTQSAGTSPDGTNNANSINEDGTAANTHFVDQAVTLSDSTEYTYSVYLKKSNRTWVMFQAYSIQVTATEAYFDLDNGVVGSTVNCTSGIQDVGNGWYRCWQTFTTGTGLTAPHITIIVAEADSDITFDGLSQESILVYGAQLEAGGFMTSYIETTTGSVTRTVDRIDEPTVSWYNQPAGTIYVDYYYPENGLAGTPALFDLSNTGAERHLTWMSASGSLQYFIQDNSSQQATLTATGITLGARTRSVAAYQLNDVEHYVDGSRVGTGDQAATMPTPTSARIGLAFDSTAPLNSHVREIRYYDERLADSTLAFYSQNGVPFPGTIAGDDGHIWPPRANDPRWTQIITDSGITASGNFIDDVHAALEAIGITTGQLDDLWKKVKAVYSITDTSEPYLY